MTTKKRRPGLSGNPARRAEQEAKRRPAASVTRQILAEPFAPETGPPRAPAGAFYDEKAHRLLTRRGWKAFEDRAISDMWIWPPSEVAEWDTDTYSEGTWIFVEEDGFRVELACDDIATPLPEVQFASLADLVADIERIEAFRPGQTPELPHGATAAPPS